MKTYTTIGITLRPGKDDDVIEWLEQLERGTVSPTIKKAIRKYIKYTKGTDESNK